MNYNQATLYTATGKDLIKVPTQVSDWNASKDWKKQQPQVGQ